MARRPVFVPAEELPTLVREHEVEFEWSAGFAISQKQKSIAALHQAACTELSVNRPLEISSKSPVGVGQSLSAFLLTAQLPDGRQVPVECAFQGSKRFVTGGPFWDLYDADPREAKRDPRLSTSGPIIGFSLLGDEWAGEPPTAFYDWLFITSVSARAELAREVQTFDAFTDIEFNPKRSLNCQARAAARFVALKMRGDLESVLSSRESFIATYGGQPRLLG